MPKNLPAFTVDKDFIFPYPLSRPSEPLKDYLEKLLGTILLTGKIPAKDQRKFAAWCALTFYYQPTHHITLDLLKLYKPKLPQFITKSQGAKNVASILSVGLEATITSNPTLIKALLKKSVFRPYLTALITEVSKSSKTPPIEFLPNLHSIQLTSPQKGYKIGDKLYVQHIPPVFNNNGYFIAAKRNSLASAAKLIGPVDATYTSLGGPLRTTFSSLEDKIRYAFTQPYLLAKPLYIEIQATLLELWNTDKVKLLAIFTAIFDAKDYHLFLRKDNIPVAITIRVGSTWDAKVVSKELSLQLFSLIPLQHSKHHTIVDPNLDLDSILNDSLPAHEKWVGPDNWVSLAAGFSLSESNCLKMGAPQISDQGLADFAKRYALPHLS